MNDANEKVKEWQEFSKHMEEYIREHTADKYSCGEDGQKPIDLIQVVSPRFCMENIVKYSLRWLNGFGKGHEVEKIAHYAQINWMKVKQLHRPEESGEVQIQGHNHNPLGEVFNGSSEAV